MSIDLQGYRAGPIGQFAAGLFKLANTRPLTRMVTNIPPNAASILAELYQGSPPPMRGELLRLDASGTDPRKAMVAFSGGKDSTAVAIKLHRTGHQVTLFRVAGINPAYPDEGKVAERVAEALGMKLLVLKVKVGRQEYVENPAKNQVILGLMVDVGLKRGVGTYAMGIHTTEEARDVAFDYGYSDAIEMHRAGKRTFEDMAQGITVETELLTNERDSYQTIIGHNPALVDLIQSCMTPLRFRGTHHRRNRARYGESIRPNRCGSCYKCAQETLLLQDLGHFPPHPALRAHALDVLERTAPQVIGDHARGMSRAELERYFTEGR